jgi:hypothetical protein
MAALAARGLIRPGETSAVPHHPRRHPARGCRPAGQHADRDARPGRPPVPSRGDRLDPGPLTPLGLHHRRYALTAELVRHLHLRRCQAPPGWTITISAKPRVGRKGWAEAGEGFAARLSRQESSTVIAPEITSLSFHGSGGIRVNITLSAAAADPASAMALAWLVIRKASGGTLSAWNIRTARTTVEGENAGLGAGSCRRRPSFCGRVHGVVNSGIR